MSKCNQIRMEGTEHIFHAGVSQSPHRCDDREHHEPQRQWRLFIARKAFNADCGESHEKGQRQKDDSHNREDHELTTHYCRRIRLLSGQDCACISLLVFQNIRQVMPQFFY